MKPLCLLWPGVTYHGVHGYRATMRGIGAVRRSEYFDDPADAARAHDEYASLNTTRSHFHLHLIHSLITARSPHSPTLICLSKLDMHLGSAAATSGIATPTRC